MVWGENLPWYLKGIIIGIVVFIIGGIIEGATGGISEYFNKIFFGDDEPNGEKPTEDDELNGEKPTEDDEPPIVELPPIKDEKPKAIIMAPAFGEPKKPITFDGINSTDDVGIIEYKWEFEDGQVRFGQNITREFAVEGNYKVKLTVKDTDDLEGSAQHTITISRTSTQKPDLKWMEDTFYIDSSYDSIHVAFGTNVRMYEKIENVIDSSLPKICVKIEIMYPGISESVTFMDCEVSISDKSEFPFFYKKELSLFGEYLITFTLDPDNKIQEENEDNNTSEHIVVVQ